MQLSLISCVELYNNDIHKPRGISVGIHHRPRTEPAKRNLHVVGHVPSCSRVSQRFKSRQSHPILGMSSLTIV
jgi:hypothetical protein